MDELFKAYREASKELDEAEASERAAASRSINARNKVNDLQKKIDAEMTKLRQDAKWNTDWHSERTRGRNLVER